MQIVIDIPENDYELALRNDYSTIYKGVHIADAIKNGTPLPKGHGRLIDADEIQFENTEFDTYSDYSRAFDAIDQADTIIEAEEEQE